LGCLAHMQEHRVDPRFRCSPRFDIVDAGFSAFNETE
jgi:hypothetical protein